MSMVGLAGFRAGGRPFHANDPRSGDDCGSSQSGREDLNLRPHGPEPCALAKLSYAPSLERVYCILLGKASLSIATSRPSRRRCGELPASFLERGPDRGQVTVPILLEGVEVVAEGAAEGGGRAVG